MNRIKLPPVIVSMLLIGAHIYQAGRALLVFLCSALPLFLFIRMPWLVRVMQAFLVIGAIEWVRTVNADADQDGSGSAVGPTRPDTRCRGSVFRRRCPPFPVQDPQEAAHD